MRACCERRFGTRDLKGRTVAVVGAGRVGSRLARRLAKAGAKLIVADIDESQARARAVARRALGGPEHRPARRRGRPGAVRPGRRDRPGRRPSACAARWSAARPTTSSPTTASRRTSRPTAILFAPDFIASAGGLINIAVELEGYDAGRATAAGGGHRADDGRGSRPGRGASGSHRWRRPTRSPARGSPALPWAHDGEPGGPRDSGQPRGDRGRHADGRAHTRGARLRRRADRQAGGLQPRRQREGPHRRGDDRRRRVRGPHRARAARPSWRRPRATPASRWRSSAQRAGTSSCSRCRRG